MAQRPSAADSTFADALTAPDVSIATRLLKAAVVEASSGRYSASSIRSALYGEYLTKLLDRIFGEHRFVMLLLMFGW